MGQKFRERGTFKQGFAMNIETLVRPCIVRIRASDGGSGTGFFIGPGRILTCRHVVRRPPPQTPKAIEVFGESQDRDQDTAYAWMASAAIVAENEYFDLAILAVDRRDEPCALLGGPGDVGDDLWAEGYIETDEIIRLQPVFARHDGEATETVKSDRSQQPLIKFGSGNIVPGMSGSPLVNLHSKAVCGVVTRTFDRNSNLGGLATPVRSVLASFPEVSALQKAYHGSHPFWWRLGINLPGPSATDDERISFVRIFPPGPMVDLSIFPPTIWRLFDNLTPEMTIKLRNTANYLRARADPDIDSHLLCIDGGTTNEGVSRFWMRAIPEATARGPRMVVALFCAAPPGALTGIESELQDLLARLRAWPASRIG